MPKLKGIVGSRPIPTMDLPSTSAMMSSPDFKERFRAEYFQLKLRLEGLESLLLGYGSGTLKFTPICSFDLLNSQARIMRLYLEILGERAELECIELEVTNDQK